MYRLGNRDEMTEMRARYEAMVNVLSDMFECGSYDIEELFDSNNNIEVGEIVKEYVENTGTLPSWNYIYREALFNFCSDNNLEPGVDVDIHTNSCIDTSIYARKGLDKDIVKKLEELFNINIEEMDE